MSPLKSSLNSVKRILNEKGVCITSIRSDHSGEFENESFRLLCEENEILHNFSIARTPQQNGVVEIKNRSLKEMAKTMLNDNSTPKHFWAEVVNTSCYSRNKIYIRLILKRLLLNFGKDENPTFHISILLDVSVSFLTLKIT